MLTCAIFFTSLTWSAALEACRYRSSERVVVIPTLVGLVPGYPDELIAPRRPPACTPAPPAWDTCRLCQVPPIRRTGWIS